ncbi:serine/threonine-protein kinase [Paenarthrobacter aurescens]|uniref:non-specific serine/threonine protein kinase n=1 Tax=Paenarthrobacter aurescens TaxID=43663 RepID=A0A4Y3NBY6_PAEAU|nr:serine/threonine-protein kinase [Paenarthrobacter aurescens]MDO6142955.1 protein kinase [Paenarthrobacter aurescens]MDO6146800.1 protein kinase [Paenarthrobacter aurescens]MDO6158046.1 protein kinase [Paenarthrobacter aurescens]MDO6162031.1 protein kinase [Paenarthrobacter aurescens]GEB19454.1 serine/threonine protein kinase [Paenarthrobacter aurescens]
MSSKRPPAPPPPIPGFKYISLLGSGGFSDVYLYEQDRPRRKVAVKVLLSDLKTEGARRRFESEANLMAQLSSHPYIVTIFEAEITENGHSYLAMEYCSRPSLDVRYRRQRFSVDEVLAVGIQVASAVETAHRAGIVHRDIKPANILVTDYNRPALTDFGISGTIGADTEDDAGMSIPWSPPEQFRGGAVDGVPVDIWALGATLYTLLAGRSPFVLPGQDNSQRELISRITNSPLPRLGRADVPESLELVLATSMAKSPESRYSSAHAFALALQRIQAELNLSVTPFEVLEEPGHGDDQHPDDNFEETRVRSIASIDPDASGTATTGSAPTFPARTFPSTVPGGTQPPAQRPSQQPTELPAQPGKPPQPVQSQAGPAAPPQFHAPAGPAYTAPGAYTASGPYTVPGEPDTAESTVLRGWQPSQPQDDLGATVSRSATGTSAVAQDDVPPADHSKRNLWLSVSGAAVLVVAIVIGVVLGAQAQPKVAPTETSSKPPADALSDGSVPEVEGLFAERHPGDPDLVDFHWKNPQPQPGDTYKYRYKSAKLDGEYKNTIDGETTTTVWGLELPVCVQVIIVRADGSASPGGPDSIACLEK